MNSPAPSTDRNVNIQPSAMAPLALYDAPASVMHDARFDEVLMQHVALNGPAACVWQASPGLVVPRTYLRSASFEDTRKDFSERGWPISVRHSGGGVVPQGPGILNISLAYAVEGRPLEHSDAAYLRLCNLMTNAISGFGIQAHPQAVQGSFCDGRFNLACNDGGVARKIAGTAQLWRRQLATDGSYLQVVLVHGLLLVATDVSLVTQQANRLEIALGNSRRYLAERATSLHTLVRQPPTDTAAFVQDVASALHDAIKHQQQELPYLLSQQVPAHD